MPVSTQHEVVQYVEQKDAKGKVIEHPILDPGDYHVKGVVEHAAAGELCSADAELSAQVISLTRTAGGGIAYEFAIAADEEPARKAKAAAADEAQKDAAAKAKASEAELEAKAQALQDAADARMAKIVAAAVGAVMAKLNPKDATAAPKS
jgi:hypothetical protein